MLILPVLFFLSFHSSLFSSFRSLLSSRFSLVLSFLFDGYVGKITYLGDGEYLRPQIEKVLESEGVKENSFFKADEKLLSKKIIASNEKISFVSVKKTGRILYIEVYKAEESAKPIDVKKEKIISTVSGAVKSINL